MARWQKAGPKEFGLVCDSVEDLVSRKISKANKDHHTGVAAYERSESRAKFPADYGNGADWYGDPEGVRGVVKTLKGRKRWEKMDALIKSARETLGAVAPKVISRRRKRRFDDAGGDMDIDRFFAGKEDYWVSMERRTVEGPGNAVIRLVVHPSASWNVKGSDYVWSGIAAAVYVDVLENAGYSVEVYAMWAGHALYENDREVKGVITLPLKAHSEPLDIGRLVMWMAHPGVYRTAVFAAWLSMRGQIKDSLSTVTGGPAAFALAAKFDPNFDMESCVLAATPMTVKTCDQALAWLRKELNRFGIED